MTRSGSPNSLAGGFSTLRLAPHNNLAYLMGAKMTEILTFCSDLRFWSGSKRSEQGEGFF